MNLTDLTEVLREHAEMPAATHDARVAAVRAKVTTRQRRRAVAGVACVVLVLVGVIYAVIPQAGGSPEPAVPVRSFPEYQSGTKLLAQAWGELPSTSVTLRFLPKSFDLKLFAKCDIGKNRTLVMHITVNGMALNQAGCGGLVASTDWASMGVVAGRPSEVTLTVDGENDYSSSPDEMLLVPPPDSGTFAIGVGEAVPVNVYPFPARPQTLEALPSQFPEPAVRADPADPARREEITVEWPGPNVMDARMNTPGRLRVLVNDVMVIDFSHWTYAVASSVALFEGEPKSGYGLDLSRGEPVRITVIPERATGDWEITLTPR